MVELEGAARRAVKGYSTGMKQRLALARLERLVEATVPQ